MIQSKIREQGNSYVVTIPREAMDKYNLHKGDTISFTPTRAETETVYILDPELEEASDRVFTRFQAAYKYLAEK
ncbi:MAG: AbrB/MazE/SpoVT family DNA-binding domain-containing protein [Chloroflexia bacterium]|nr:AbrB/MazE/SpoVT family DNA-binding domain-containing protein [Chloroflexia bacterium]